MTVQCFLIEPTDRVVLTLRRFRHGSRWDAEKGASVETERGKCPLPQGYHDASALLGEADAIWSEHEGGGRSLAMRPEVIAPNDPRWPQSCACGEPFTDADERQVFQDLIWRRVDTGEIGSMRSKWSKTPGAMWDAAWWIPAWGQGHDGRSLHVILPNGREWDIDGEASNCTRVGDRSHRCWLRTGEPPRITVGKSGPGFSTCAAGAGSIQAGDYHGFLVNGRFT